ncbi:GNAT family N-acetyltransferase [Sphingomonas parapaucimobilis]|uniref:GNAT family N-acetyltransferase n=1 Tax=Sphingomonas parapaucimobilis TaxID=28213 RepID=UPI0039E8220B
MTIIRTASFPEDAAGVVDIWREFVASPSVSLDYQCNEAEFAALPGKYARPAGCVLLAERDGAIDGCIAFRCVTPAIAEMKRLYVRPRARGERLGHKLIARLIEEARGAGYSEIRLDVLAEFIQAQKLYAEFGFVAAEAISYNPLPGTAFLGLKLK